MRNLKAVGLFLLASAAPLHAANLPIAEAAKLFGARPDAYAADLSPRGDKVVYLSGESGSRTAVKILDLTTNAEQRVISLEGRPENFSWCEFASETKLVCRYAGNVPYNDLIVGMGRLVVIDLEKKTTRPLGVRQSAFDAGFRQNDGSILDWLPDDKGGGAILMARNYVAQDSETGTMLKRQSDGGLGVDRIDLAMLEVTRIETPRKSASFYMTDGHGAVRLMGIDQRDAGGLLKGVTEIRYRPTGSKEWRPFGTFDVRSDSGMVPLAIDRESDSLYFLKRLDGRDALYRQKLDGAATPVLVAKNDQVDVDDVVRVRRGAPVIGYSFNDDRPRVTYFDPAFAKLATSLGKALPDFPLIDFVGASQDQSKLLISAASDRNPGIYYVLDRAKRETRPILANRPQMIDRPLAPVRSVVFTAADGTKVPAYVTASAEGPAKSRPAVVLPHGGPSARDQWGFDWLSQFLAARGYVVIQPQYRGSAGYGDSFMGDNAFRDWRTAMNDIRDSAKYLVAEGIADPGRIAIVGWSYGGYAALQSAVVDPGRYKAVVAIAPVTDLSALRRDAVGFTDEKIARDFIGTGGNLAEGSPLQHAALIKPPVLLVHGDMDNNVRFAHSQRMEAALKKAGTPVEFLRYKGLEHQLDDATARTEMLTRIGELLQNTIGE